MSIMLFMRVMHACNNAMYVMYVCTLCTHVMYVCMLSLYVMYVGMCVCKYSVCLHGTRAVYDMCVCMFVRYIWPCMYVCNV